MNESVTSPPGRSLASLSSSTDPAQPVSGFQRAADAMRMVLQLGEKLLPPPYGHLASTASNLMKPQAPPPMPPVNLMPIQDGLAELQAEHRDLRGQVIEQNASLKRIENQLELANEATDRNARALQKMTDELKAVGNRVEMLKAVGHKAKLVALVTLGLLVVTIALNVILLLHFRRLMP
jgi:hypothetical protein